MATQNGAVIIAGASLHLQIDFLGGFKLKT